MYLRPQIHRFRLLDLKLAAHIADVFTNKEDKLQLSAGSCPGLRGTTDWRLARDRRDSHLEWEHFTGLRGFISLTL
ncbi:hypothetical protein J6590_088200 [Homalodisca vitripennis]|nr:hypothetical protein J6590_088200 [Homalodisca vitripennis]